MRKIAKISVIIPVYNGSRTLRKTLQTVRSQNDLHLETIVVDDGSDEDISEMVREMGASLLRLERNSGPAVARSRGAETASGETLLFTDSDVWLPENLVETLRSDFAEQDCECVQGTFSEHCPHPDFFSQYKNLYNRYVLGLLGPWIDTTYTSVTAVKKDFFLQCGGFDENITSASVEDRTLGENILRNGGKIFLDHRIEVVHNKRLSMSGFFRNQFKRSRDLAKLLIRQKERGFSGKGDSFGTNSKQAMLRLPAASACLASMILVPWSSWFLLPAVVFGLGYLILSRKWVAYLYRRRGGWFAVRGWVVDFLDALVCAGGVATGFFEYKILSKKY